MDDRFRHPFLLYPEHYPVESVLAAAQERERDRHDQQHIFEFPTCNVLARKLPVHLRDQEADGAEHYEGEPDGREPREEAEEHAEPARRFRDGKEAQRVEEAGGHLRGWLSFPEPFLVRPVHEEDRAESDAEQEQRDVVHRKSPSLKSSPTVPLPASTCGPRSLNVAARPSGASARTVEFV